MKSLTKARIWTTVLAALLLYSALALFLPRLLGAQGRTGWTITTALVLAGVGVAGALLRYLLKHYTAAPAAPVDADQDAITAAIAAAEERLTRSNLAGGSTLAAFPTILLLGPEGSTKTTTVVQSGLEPDLLAGETTRGEQVVPTRLLNLWYARDTVFAEIGRGILSDRGRQTRLLQRLRPERLRAALGRGAQAPRIAIVCFSCEELAKAGAGDVVLAAARQLHALLAEAADVFGVRLPVYVLFTKLDKVHGFTEFVQNLTADEVREVLGSTLPPMRADGSVYAEQEARRVSGAFQEIYASLVERRLLVLPREDAVERRLRAYEFPREFRKLETGVTQFLLELCRPSQLQVSQILRGFYFTGVRPVVVHDVASARPQVVRAPEANADGSGATMVFNQPRAGMLNPPMARPAAGGVRRPQWVFLQRLFPEVILADRVALRATASGTRVNYLRRAMAASLAALALVLATGFTVSWAANRDMARRTLSAARATTDGNAAENRDLPPLVRLQHLDTLRQQVSLIDGYRREGPPWRLRWGLYSGNAIYDGTRSIYFDRLERLMLGATRRSMVQTLQSLPDSATETGEYTPTYDLLRAYLVTHGRHEHSAKASLTPVLMTGWLANRQLDPDRSSLARRQFDFYAEELRVDDPYDVKPDDGAVDRARRFLYSFGSGERIYGFMTSDAERKGNAPIQFSRLYPEYARHVQNSYVVPGAFTEGGWKAMQASLQKSESFVGEEWVLGPDLSGTRPDAAQLERELRARYERDFVEHWREYLSTGRVLRYGALPEATNRLGALSGATSPLITMLALASRNTGFDSTTTIARAFQPVHVVSDPNVRNRIRTPENEPYLQGLQSLKDAVEGVTLAPGDAVQAAVMSAQQSASQARMSVGQLTTKFALTDTTAAAASAVEALLLAPIEALTPHLVDRGPQQDAKTLNQAGENFCKAFGTTLAKFPFNSSARNDATPAEVKALFGPGGGVETLYREDLEAHFRQTGGQLQTKPGGQVAPNPAFAAFYQRAVQFGALLFAGQDREPVLTFSMRVLPSEALPSVTVVIGTNRQTFSRAQQSFAYFNWSPGTSQIARIEGRIGGGNEVTMYSATGSWALFRLFHDGRNWQRNGDTYTVEWPAMNTAGQAITGSGGAVRVQAEIDPEGKALFLQRGYFDGLRCVSRVAR